MILLLLHALAKPDNCPPQVRSIIEDILCTGQFFFAVQTVKIERTLVTKVFAVQTVKVERTLGTKAHVLARETRTL